MGSPTFGLRTQSKFVSSYHSYIARMRRSLQGNITFPFALTAEGKLASFTFQSKQTSLVLCTGDANFYSSLSLLIAYAAAYNQTPSQYIPHPSSLQFLAATCGVPFSSEFGAASFSDSTSWPRLKRTIIASGSNGSTLAAFNAASKHRCRALIYSLNYNINVSTKRIGCSGFRLGHENERIVTYFLAQCPADAFDMSNVTIIGGHFSLSLLPSNRLICV
ncbi:MAG: SAM-dependent methyltransferase [Candidatus Hodgkinia cicadicola]